MMEIEFKAAEKSSNVREGIAKDENKEVEFVITDSTLEVSSKYGDDFLLELIQTILRGHYVYLKYEGALYTRLSDISSILQMSRKGEMVTA